jgi:hypothetical protein
VGGVLLAIPCHRNLLPTLMINQRQSYIGTDQTKKIEYTSNRRQQYRIMYLSSGGSDINADHDGR